MSDEPQPIEAARSETVSRSSVFRFAAYVGSVVLPLYQIILMVAWGSPDLFEPLEMVWGISALAIGGAIYGLVAAALYYAFRWFFKLDSDHDRPHRR